jgi:hypothetical protein
MAAAHLTPVGVGIHNLLIASDFFTPLQYRCSLRFVARQLYGARVEIVYVLPTDEYVLSEREGLHAATEAARPISSWSVLTAAEDWGKSSWLCSRENISALPGTGIDRWTEYSPSIATSTRHTTSLRRAISLGAHMLLWNMPPPWPRSTVRNLTFCTSSTVSIGHPVGHVAVRYRVGFGNVPSAISRAASEINSDFIVLGVQRSSGALDRFLWPIAYELVRSATGPVLTIRGSGPHR